MSPEKLYLKLDEKNGLYLSCDATDSQSTFPLIYSNNKYEWKVHISDNNGNFVGTVHTTDGPGQFLQPNITASDQDEYEAVIRKKNTYVLHYILKNPPSLDSASIYIHNNGSDYILSVDKVSGSVIFKLFNRNEPTTYWTLEKP